MLLRLVVGRRTNGGTCSRAITKDWRRLIVISIVGNRATSRGDQQLIVQSIVATYDRSYDRSWRPTTVRTINRDDQRPVVRSIVGRHHPDIKRLSIVCHNQYYFFVVPGETFYTFLQTFYLLSDTMPPKKGKGRGKRTQPDQEPQPQPDEMDNQKGKRCSGE